MPTTILMYLVGFGFISIASREIGKFLSRFQLPLISGYLIAGILAGPFVLDFIHKETIASLRFIDDFALAYIAFAAGSEMYLEELRSRLRSISWHVIGQLITIYAIGTFSVYLLTDIIPFTQGTPPAFRLAVAMLIGSILVVRSPSSAIAITNELRAKGPFTKTLLGVTIAMDVVVVVLFAISTSVADVLITAEGFDLGFVVLLVLELGLSFLLGGVVGGVLHLILKIRQTRLMKTVFILGSGFFIFVFTAVLRHWTHEHLPFEVLVEPLLICMIGSFMVTNYSRFRDEFIEILEGVGPAIYVIFFTLVGDALQLDVLVQTLPIAIALFLIRLAGMFIGSIVGGTIAGDPQQQNRIAWMAYVTQAGIGLGLAKEVAVEFPEMGEQFATLIIATIVLSQLIGPPLLKSVIKRVGESHLPGKSHLDAVRDALILGITPESRALAWRLKARNWQIVIADTDARKVADCSEEGIDAHLITAITLDSLSGIMSPSTDVIVTFFEDDDLNWQACELAYEQFGTPRMIVRLNDYNRAERFRELGAIVIYPSAALVSLFYQVARAPSSAATLMETESDYEMVQITVSDPDVHGLRLRDVRLPGDVLVLQIQRDGRSLLAHGYTKLRLQDEVTLMGRRGTLEEVTLRLGY